MPSPVHPYSDYGVALRTLKSARSWLGLMLFLCVLAQFVGFALMWWTPQPYEGMKGQWKTDPSPLSVSIDKLIARLTATQPATAPAKPPEAFFPGTDESRRLNVRNQWATVYAMSIPVTQLAGLIAVSSQAIIVFVTLLVVLVAQAPGVAQITRSMIWSVLLLFMFLPWQYFARDFPIPGVIYSYTELLQRIGPHVAGDKVYPFELFGLLALIITAERFRAGIMIAIGHPLQSILQPHGTTPPTPRPSPSPRPIAAVPTAKPGARG